MCKPDARCLVVVASALALLDACSNSRGLSPSRDGSAGATGGAMVGTGGSQIGTGGATSGTGGASSDSGGTSGGLGGTTVTGGARMTGGVGTGGLPGTGGKVSGTGGSGSDAGPNQDTRRVCPPLCDLYCPTGFQIDSDGCEICKCNPSPVDAREAPTCPGVCAIYCPYGNVLDSNGCATCACNPAPDAGADNRSLCPTPVCPPIYCDFGYANDVNGCPTCSCNPDPSECPAIKCKACPFGYLKDAKGCDTCDCAPDPGKACTDIADEAVCAATAGRCRWLVPGCGDPALPAAGCYDKTFIDCTTTCPGGRSCLQRSINPCYNVECLSCGQTISICL